MRPLTGRITSGDAEPGLYQVADADGLILDRRDAPGQVAIAVDPAMRQPERGDLVSVIPGRMLRTLYRSSAQDNFLFLTNRCQNRCTFCSQPPTVHADDWLIAEVLQAIAHLPRGIASVGITGGEPTLAGPGLLAVLAALTAHHPTCAIHLLSNGRNFAWLGLAQRVAAIGCADLVVGVPIHADSPPAHDAIAGSAGAWGETVRGCLALARCGIAVEIRVVLVRDNVARLEQLAAWITRNMPFVVHVAWMAQEVTGYAATAGDRVWVNPESYHVQLRRAVTLIQRWGIRTSIYNLPHCWMPADLWPWAVKSISSWKVEHPDACTGCRQLAACSGLFATGTRLTPRPFHQSAC